MSLVQLREEFIDIVRELPQSPQFVCLSANDNNPNFLKDFENAIEKYNEQLKLWHAGMQQSIAQLRTLFNKARIENSQYLVVLLDDLDNLASFVSSLMRYHVKFNLELPLSAKGNLSIEKMRKKSALLFYDYLSNIKDELDILCWDYDPDARGGMAFNSADDLIAALHTSS